MTDPQGPSEPEATVTPAQVTIRRAPKVPVFLVLGAALGALVTIIVTSAFPTDPSVGYAATIGYFLLYGIPIGVVVGGVVAIVLDRVASRRAKSITVERTDVAPLPEDAPLPELPELPEGPTSDAIDPGANGSVAP